MLKIKVKNQQQELTFEHLQGPLLLGRAPQGEGPSFVLMDPTTSRKQLIVESVAPGRVRLKNLGGPITIDGHGGLEKQAKVTLPLPVHLNFGQTQLGIFAVKVVESRLSTIMRPAQTKSLHSVGRTPSPQQLAEWFETLFKVHRAAAGTRAFFDETARAIVELVGLDRGLVLLREDEQWAVQARFARGDRAADAYSKTVLAEVLAKKSTVFEKPASADAPQSLQMVDAYVASPLLDESERVIGVLFGSRDVRTQLPTEDQRLGGVSPLEAQVVQLLAAAASAGMMRAQKEREAAKLRLQFEQFFSPQLVEELQQNPRLLEAAERELTVLFADLRGFSRISERLGAEQTFRLVSEVMDMLTEQVMSEGGVIIDYYGDGMAAMWNVPKPQPDHALRACRAALAMQEKLGTLGQRWAQALGAPLRMGVGMHTGLAQVGNAGSRRRQKYGPRGHTVNLASRVEGATKHLGVPMLISGATREALGPSLPTRRLCQVRVVGIQQPVTLYELAAAEPTADWRTLSARYEALLEQCERGELSEAVQGLQALHREPTGAQDTPTRKLLAQAQRSVDGRFDPIFELDSK